MSLLDVTERLSALTNVAPSPKVRTDGIYSQLRDAILIADRTGAILVKTQEAIRLVGDVQSLNDLDIRSDAGVFTVRLSDSLRYVEYTLSRVELGGVMSTHLALRDCTGEYVRDAESRSRNALYAVVSEFATAMVAGEARVTVQEMLREAAAVLGAVDVAIMELGINESNEYAAHPPGVFGRMPQHMLIDALTPQLFSRLHAGKTHIAFSSQCTDAQARSLARAANVKTSLYLPVVVHGYPVLAIAFHFALEYTDEWFFSVCDPLKTLVSLYATEKLRLADAQDLRLLMSVAVADSIPLPVCYLNHDGAIVYQNAFFAELQVKQPAIDPRKLPGAAVSLVTLGTERGSVDVTVAAVSNEPYPYIGVASGSGVTLSKTFLFLRDALDSLRYPVVTTDRAGDIVYANSAARSLLVGVDNGWDSTPAVERLRDHLLICAKGKSKVCYPDVFGDRAYNITLVRLVDSGFRGVAACLQPADSNDYYRMLATDVPVGILSLDGNGSITFMNNAAQELLSGLVIDNIKDLVAKGYLPFLHSRMLRVKRERRLPPAIYRLANGKYVEAQSVLVNAESEHETIHVVMRSVSSTEMAEAPLQTALNAIPYPALVFDNCGLLVFANQHAADTLHLAAPVLLPDIQQLTWPRSYSELYESVCLNGYTRAVGSEFSMNVSVFGDVSVGLMLGVVK